MNTNNEIWKDVIGYEGLYQVSCLGNVKKSNGKLLKNNVDSRGYERVFLADKFGFRRVHKIHRVVATMFLENIENKPQVNHIDCNKQNNNVYNLEWCTAKENINHAQQNGLLRKKIVKSDNGYINTEIYSIFLSLPINRIIYNDEFFGLVPSWGKKHIKVLLSKYCKDNNLKLKPIIARKNNIVKRAFIVTS